MTTNGGSSPRVATRSLPTGGSSRHKKIATLTAVLARQVAGVSNLAEAQLLIDAGRTARMA
jgi:hypothetical protein